MNPTSVAIVCSLSFIAASFTAGCGPTTVEPDAPVSPDAASAHDTGPRDTGTAPRDAPGADAGSVSTLVRATEGGTVASADGLFEIVVAPGALSADTRIAITRVSTSDVPSDIAATAPSSGVYAVEPEGLVFGGDGAEARFHFASAPPEIIDAAAGLRANLFAASRAAAGGAIEWRDRARTIHRASGRVDVEAPLPHLSFHWATSHGPDDGNNWLGVIYPPQSAEVGEAFRSSVAYRVDRPTSTVEIGIYTRRDDVVIAQGGIDPDAWAPALGFDEGDSTADNAWHTEAPAGGITPGIDHQLTPRPLWYCDTLGTDQRVTEAVFTASSVSGGSYSVAIEEDVEFSCHGPAPVVISILESIPVEREGDVLVMPPPRLDARVEVRPSTTETISLGNGWYLDVEDPADPPVVGPAAFTATNSGATLTGTASSDEYTLSFDDAASWDASAPTTFHFGPQIAEVAPAPDLHATLGALNGIDTEIDLGTLDEATHIRLRVSGPAGEPLTIHGFSVSDTFSMRQGLELAAAFLGTMVDALTAGDFDVEIGTRSYADVEVGGVSLQLVTGRDFHLDGSDLVTTCSATSTYCTSACVDTATDPANCGGCGLTPAEACNGRDDDCDGLRDEGCPRDLQWLGGSSMSPTFGEGVGGSSTLAASCGAPSIAIGICGRIDVATGNIRSIGVHCGYATLATDTSARPYAYSVAVTDGPIPCSTTSGGSSGGTVYTLDCPSGMVADGITGIAGSHVGQLALRCAAWEILPGTGRWLVARSSTSMTTMAGTGMGSAFAWTVPDDGTTGYPGGLNYFGGAYEVPGTYVSVFARGTSPFLRVY